MSILQYQYNSINYPIYNNTIYTIYNNKIIKFQVSALVR